MNAINETPIYRIDKFTVPQLAKAVFIEQVLRTHKILKLQPGFIRDLVLEQCAGAGRFNFVTLVEWQSQTAIDAARAVMTQFQTDSGFNPQAFMTQWAIEADIANYRAHES